MSLRSTKMRKCIFGEIDIGIEIDAHDFLINLGFFKFLESEMGINSSIQYQDINLSKLSNHLFHYFPTPNKYSYLHYSSLLRSPVIVSTSALPSPKHIFLVSSSRFAFLPVNIRVTQCLANWRASSLPRPLLAPVIRTTGLSIF